jgi:hypothetical protein
MKLAAQCATLTQWIEEPFGPVTHHRIPSSVSERNAAKMTASCCIVLHATGMAIWPNSSKNEAFRMLLSLELHEIENETMLSWRNSQIWRQRSCTDLTWYQLARKNRECGTETERLAWKLHRQSDITK